MDDRTRLIARLAWEAATARLGNALTPPQGLPTRGAEQVLDAFRTAHQALTALAMAYGQDLSQQVGPAE